MATSSTLNTWHPSLKKPGVKYLDSSWINACDLNLQLWTLVTRTGLPSGAFCNVIFFTQSPYSWFCKVSNFPVIPQRLSWIEIRPLTQPIQDIIFFFHFFFFLKPLQPSFCSVFIYCSAESWIFFLVTCIVKLCSIYSLCSRSWLFNLQYIK